jgi:hypothetical protein
MAWFFYSPPEASQIAKQLFTSTVWAALKPFRRAIHEVFTSEKNHKNSLSKLVVFSFLQKLFEFIF